MVEAPLCYSGDSLLNSHPRAAENIGSVPKSEAYNSLVILDNGYLVMKQISDTDNAVLSILDPATLQPACEHIEAPEPSISRLSARGNTVYVTGTRSIFRYHWSDENGKAELDSELKLRNRLPIVRY